MMLRDFLIVEGYYITYEESSSISQEVWDLMLGRVEEIKCSGDFSRPIDYISLQELYQEIVEIRRKDVVWLVIELARG